MLETKVQGIVRKFEVECPLCSSIITGHINDFYPVTVQITKPEDDEIDIVGWQFDCPNCKNKDIVIRPKDLKSAD
jgi:Zn finger protein HypA/HybF involved in hydrogenase expression